MRNLICDDCGKEIKVNENYIVYTTLLEKFNEGRRVSLLGEKELKITCKKCTDKEDTPKHEYK